jgi:PKD repeat protein
VRLVRTALLVLAAVCAHAASLPITPTTTLTAETTNNTSAADTWTTSSNGNLGATNVSKADHRTLLYPGATTAIYSHLLLWFGPSNHIQVGYRSDDYNQVKRQVDDHISRGLAGAIIDWYGTSHTVDTTATQYLMQYAESLPGYPFKFALMEDKGALLNCANTSGCDLNAQLISDLTYIVNAFSGSPTYLKFIGQPAILFFGLEAYNIDWNYVKANVPGNPLFIFENAGGLTHTASDGGFGWVMINASDPTDWKSSYLSYFYSSALAFPQEYTFGAVYKGFNDSLASWSLNRIMSQQCGQVWLNTWNEIGEYYSSSNQLESLQLVTWNDYEEGTEIESGIDNCLSVSATISGGTLSWMVNGNENTLDHYTAFISIDGENLMPLADIAPGIHFLDLSQFALGPGKYTLYVKAVGKPSIANHMSPAATVTIGEPPGIVLNATPTSGIAPLEVAATVSCSSGTAASTLIDFGDGTSAQSASALHTYSTPGIYSVSATVTDVYGLSSSTSQAVTVAPNQPPVAVLSVSPNTGLVGSVVEASSANSSDPDDAVAASSIDFGDGTVLSGSDVTHAYSAPGTYTVTATVTDARGAQSAATAKVTISDFSLTVTAQNGTVSPGQPATFVITVTPVQALNQPVSLTCAGVPAGYTCGISLDSVSLAATPVTATLSVAANSSSASLRVKRPAFFALWLPLAGIMPLGSLGYARKCTRRVRWLLPVVLSTMLLLAGCGGGPAQGNHAATAPAPANTFTLSVTGAVGALQHSTSVVVAIR